MSTVTLKIAKRRVDVRLLLADGKALDGALYADVQRLDGTPATLLDRLHDPREKYLPLATTDRHVLLNRSQIVTVELERHELLQPRAETAHCFSLKIALVIGAEVTGRVFALLPHAHARPLDYFNRTVESFVAVHREPTPLLVNTAYIVSVAELHDG